MLKILPKTLRFPPRSQRFAALYRDFSDSNKSSEHYDVIIVGGGGAGLSLAGAICKEHTSNLLCTTDSNRINFSEKFIPLRQTRPIAGRGSKVQGLRRKYLQQSSVFHQRKHSESDERYRRMGNNQVDSLPASPANAGLGWHFRCTDPIQSRRLYGQRSVHSRERSTFARD